MAKNYDLEIQKNLDQIKKLTEVNKELTKKKRVAVQKREHGYPKCFLKFLKSILGKFRMKKFWKLLIWHWKKKEKI